jgi:hypothetical protein
MKKKGKKGKKKKVGRPRKQIIETTTSSIEPAKLTKKNLDLYLR